MEAGGISPNITAVIDLSSNVAVLCFQYSVAVASARADIIRLQSQVNSLAVALRGVKRLVEGPNRRLLTTSHELADSIHICTDELRRLQDKLETRTGHEAMRRFGLRALKWPFNCKEVEGVIANLGKYEKAILLGLQLDQMSLLLSINERIENMHVQVAPDMSIVRNPNFTTRSYETICGPGQGAGLVMPQQLAILRSDTPIDAIYGGHSRGGKVLDLYNAGGTAVRVELQQQTKAMEGIQPSSTGLCLPNDGGKSGSKIIPAFRDLTMLSSGQLSLLGSTSHKFKDLEGVYDDAKTYYTSSERHVNRAAGRSRSYSQNNLTKQFERIGIREGFRRSSNNEFVGDTYARRFLIDVDWTLKSLQEQEDSSRNLQVTLAGDRPKVFSLRTAASGGYNRYDIQGKYMLSNLLQELTLAKEYGRKHIVLDVARLNENPVNRLSRLIRDHFWEALTRQIVDSTDWTFAIDPKDCTDDPRPRIYVPVGAQEQVKFYQQVAIDRPDLRIDVQILPEKITPKLVRDLYDKPGLLALEAKKVKTPGTDKETLEGLPFVVPGGKLKELHGWDSYMIVLGLLTNSNLYLAKSIVLNIAFCIRHYGKIPDATRSYSLCQSQPPFLTDMALRVYDSIKHEPDAKEFLRTALMAAIKEYHNVWVAEPRLDPTTGLSRYRPEGLGISPEVVSGHLLHVLETYAKKYGMTWQNFVQGYNTKEIKEPELDEYMLHDGATRESGHYISSRLEGVCANLATIDLNSLLFKYEVDIARIIRNSFDDRLVITEEVGVDSLELGSVLSSAVWDRRAKRRRVAINKYLWNEAKSMYFDYDTVKKEQTTYESATTFWALWAGVMTPLQATNMVQKALPKFEMLGGLVSGTEISKGQIAQGPATRQWDYPYGWAPHQILAWTGLLRYRFTEQAERLAYKWLWMITKTFVDFDGVVAEKYDVTRAVDSRWFDAECDSQGLNINRIAREGFGSVNASYVYGLQITNAHMRRALGTLTPFETFFSALEEKYLEELAE